MHHPNLPLQRLRLSLGLMAGGALWWLPLVASADPSSSHDAHPAVQHTAMSHQTPGWAEQLKGQTILEDTMAGRPERAAMVERQHERIMVQMQQDLQTQTADGFYNNMSMMHQYGAGGQDLMLVSDPRIEPGSMQGGQCPAGAPVRKYDISTINIEISINQWLDYYPGYMYVLTENLEKAREAEAKNKAGREKEGYDPGAVANGLQNQWIQPLVIRANQGDCVRFSLQNKLEGGADVSLHIHGSSMVISATGKAATTTNPDSIAAQNKSVELEWYIH